MKEKITKPSILPGFMELLPNEQISFNNIKDVIISNYEKAGFIPLDTPVIEKSEVLLAKGGGETEKQVYRFDKGDTDLSLRFDLTVPLARYVSQHFSDLKFPFRRYQISKVFRGERNQKGRFREFYQCDIDIVGHNDLSLMNDAEIPSIIYSIFKELNFGDFKIKMNHRKILNGFFEYLKIEDKTLALRILDKIDKIGLEAVQKELSEIGVDDKSLKKVEEFIKINGDSNQIIKSLKSIGIENEEFKQGVFELEEVIKYISAFEVPNDYYEIDLKIARGLDYYTGMVYETFLTEYQSIGSVCSGGRYENLAGYYTKQKLPGVGISIGLTRLFYQLNEAKLLDLSYHTKTKALILPMQDEFIVDAIELTSKLRKQGIISQTLSEKMKFAKKMDYANKLGIPKVIILGEDEIKSKKYALKDMKTSTQELKTLEEICEILK